MPNISIHSMPEPGPFNCCSETFRESLRQMGDDLASKKAAKSKVRVAMWLSDIGPDVEDIPVSDKGSPVQ